MLRRTGFKKPSYARQPPSAPKRLERGTPAAVGGEVRANPKTEPHRNRALLDMANGKNCLLMIPSDCMGGTETTVACHSNSSKHGKAGARKADDEYSVWGCFGCHKWLDTGPATMASKENYFEFAHKYQIAIWRTIAAGQPSKDQRAAQWALEQLGIKTGSTPIDAGEVSY